MQLSIKTIVNRPVDSNCFVLYNHSNSDCLIIDPGTEDCSDLLFFLNNNQLVPTYILLTHEHFDHIWGVNKLLELYNCFIVCSEKCLKLIGDRKTNLSLFHDQVGFDIKTNRHRIVEDGTLIFSSFTIRMKESLGHSLGSVIFWLDEILFVGDLVIKNQKTVTKLPGGNKIQLKESFIELMQLFSKKNMVVYPGHGEKFCLNEIDYIDLI